MRVKPKNFRCTNCGNAYYTDAAKCNNCAAIGTLKPIEKACYKLYLNDTLYGAGDLLHINELIRDYVVTNAMYGKGSCQFRIEKIT